jgi:hypothetical protein
MDKVQNYEKITLLRNQVFYESRDILKSKKRAAVENRQHSKNDPHSKYLRDVRRSTSVQPGHERSRMCDRHVWTCGACTRLALLWCTLGMGGAYVKECKHGV